MKLKIAIVFGGMSTEHEVSIISALQAMENIDKNKYDIYPVYIDKRGVFYYDEKILNDINTFKRPEEIKKRCSKVIFANEDEKVYIKKLSKKLFSKDIISLIDVVFPIVHGTNVEDGNLQGFFKTLGIPCVGSDCLSSALGMDKYVMKKFLKSENINVIDGSRYDIVDYKNVDNIISDVEKKYGYPVIVKPVNLGSSIGITKAKDRNELLNSIELAFSFSNLLIIERAITCMREINCAVLGNRFDCIASVLEEPLSSGEILDFSDKYLSGKKSKSGFNKISNNKINSNKNSGMASLTRRIPAEVDSETENTIKEMAMKTFKTIGCSGVARIDFIIDKTNNEIFVNEINTIPGSLAFYLWDKMGISYKELLDRLIKISLDDYRLNKNLQYVFESNILK